MNEKALLVTEIKPLLVVSLVFKNIIKHIHLPPMNLRLVSHNNVLIVREIIEDNIVKVKIEATKLVEYEKSESISCVHCRVWAGQEFM